MTDLDKARKIVTQRWISQPEALKENIAKAVAEGIALGRKDGLEMAANERWMNEHEALKENVAKAVAEGIALGRKEGFEMALKTIGEGINGLPTHHLSNYGREASKLASSPQRQLVG